MSKNQWKALALSLATAIFCLVILIVIPLSPQKVSAQVPSVDYFMDIKPTDWYYPQLQKLTEQWGCVVGFPDGTYRPEQVQLRASAVATFNACMDRFQERIANVTADAPQKSEIAKLNNLLTEFQKQIQLIEQSKVTK